MKSFHLEVPSDPKERRKVVKEVSLISVIGIGVICITIAVAGSSHTTNTTGTNNSGSTPSSTSDNSSSISVSPQPVAAPTCSTYQAIDSRTWLEIVKDPDSYKDQCFTVYGEVTQFDAATGTGNFRADIGGVQQAPQYGFVNYPTNTYLTGSPDTFKDVVEKDLFTANVMVLGSYSYDTQIGGQTTVPQLQVNTITVTGTVGN